MHDHRTIFFLFKNHWCDLQPSPAPFPAADKIEVQGRVLPFPSPLLDLTPEFTEKVAERVPGPEDLETGAAYDVSLSETGSVFCGLVEIENSLAAIHGKAGDGEVSKQRKDTIGFLHQGTENLTQGGYHEGILCDGKGLGKWEVGASYCCLADDPTDA